jgi:UDP:flavonoid glycosyltransferase YjiC (YdhE family)
MVFVGDGGEAMRKIVLTTIRSLGDLHPFLAIALALKAHGFHPEEGGIFTCAYTPHSLIFPRAGLIVHHGGIGTTGQALRVGKPQLVVPHMGDKPDNTRRIVVMGLAKRCPPPAVHRR